MLQTTPGRRLVLGFGSTCARSTVGPPRQRSPRQRSPRQTPLGRAPPAVFTPGGIVNDEGPRPRHIWTEDSFYIS